MLLLKVIVQTTHDIQSEQRVCDVHVYNMVLRLYSYTTTFLHLPLTNAIRCVLRVDYTLPVMFGEQFLYETGNIERM